MNVEVTEVHESAQSEVPPLKGYHPWSVTGRPQVWPNLIEVFHDFCQFLHTNFDVVP
jgi:hypothetical protein